MYVITLYARAAEHEDWIKIYPSQLEMMSKAGYQVKATETIQLSEPTPQQEDYLRRVEKAAFYDTKLIRIRDVEEITGMKKSSLYNLMAQGKFPRSTKVGSNARWSYKEVTQWVWDRLAARQNIDERTK